MPYAGQIWTDHITGDIIEMIATAKETQGEKVIFKLTLKPGGFKPVEHLHIKQDEHFEILKGEFGYVLDGKESRAIAGEKITLPRGHGHTHYNASASEDLVMVQTITPALDIAVFLENLFGLMADGKVKNGDPGFLQVMLWSKYYESKTYLAKLPLAIQYVVRGIAVPIARLKGLKPVYKKYSGFDA